MKQIQLREPCEKCNGMGMEIITECYSFQGKDMPLIKAPSPECKITCIWCHGEGYTYSKWFDCEVERLPVADTDGKTLRYLNTVVFREEI